MNHTPKRSRLRRWGGRIALLTVALLVGLLICEVALRAFGIAYPSPRQVYRGKIVMKRSDAMYVLRTTEATRRVRCNRWGFHDVDHPDQSGAYRFLLLGDSFLEAAQVPVAEGLAARLRSRFSEAPPFAEVISAGVSGSGVAYQYALWDLFFRGRIDHDHVVLTMFLGNELGDNHPDIGNAPSSPGVTLEANGALRYHADRASTMRRVGRALARNLATAHLLQQAAHRSERAREEESPAAKAKEAAPSTKGAWDEAVRGTLARVRIWAGELRAEGKALSVFVFNDGAHYLGNQPERAAVVRLVRGLEALAADSDIALLSFDVGARSPRDLFLEADDALGHFSAEGHRHVATQLFPFLRAQLPD